MIKVCEVCGKEFNVRPSKVKIGKGKFCSKKCFDSFQAGKAWLKPSGIIIECKMCGIAFYVMPGLIKRSVYCSRKCFDKSKKLYVPSAETIDKISRAVKKKGVVPPSAKGKKYSVEHRRKIGRSGDSNWNWKGGVTPENQKVRRSAEYKEWRKKVFERDGYRCVECKKGNENGERTSIQADHIKPFYLHPELRLDVNNGRTLCVDCHKKTPTYLNRWVQKNKSV